MLILSFIFLTMAVIGLVRGKFLHGFLVKMADETVKMKQIKGYKLDNTFLIKGLLYIAFAFGYIITYVLYLNAAIHIDLLKYPTLFMIAYCIYGFVKGLVVGNKNKLKTEEDIIKYKSNAYKKYTIGGFIGHLISIAYHCYIIYLLVFI